MPEDRSLRRADTGTHLARDGGVLEAPDPTGFHKTKKLPLLSFVVVNYNYGRFLETCVTSIMEQDYEAIECVIVDNASTDESPRVIEALARQYPALQIIYNSENLGQNAASCAGLRLTRGSYVAFVDADDYLLPAYAATHIRTHLSLPQAFGFTSGDMVQMVDDTIVRGNYQDYYLTRLPGMTKPLAPEDLRDIRDLRGVLGTPALEADTFAAKLRLVSRTAVLWVWSPTSGNVYRRDAISLFANNPNLTKLRFSMDAYYNFGINAFGGSILIEKPLAVYRIHKANWFTRRATLQGVLTYHKEMDDGARAAFFALEHVLRNYETFVAQVPDIENLNVGLDVLRRLAARKLEVWPRIRTLLTKLSLARFAKRLEGRFDGHSALERSSLEHDRANRAK